MWITVLATSVPVYRMDSVLVLLEPLRHNVFAILDFLEISVNVSTLLQTFVELQISYRN